MKKAIFAILSISLVWLAVSCSEEHFYNKEYKIENGWDRDSLLKFEVEISDTLTPYSVFFIIGNDDAYMYRNLYMFVTIDFPGGIQRVDTVDCMLADAKGKWYGEEVDENKYENLLLYRKNVRFPFRGKYVFTLEQAMRHKVMSGINKIGLRIEKAKK